MAKIEVPNINFGKWQKWHCRPRPSEDFDVPVRFGILGLYMLAATESEATLSSSPEERHLQGPVVYIGMSTHVEQRLERTHKAVVKYRKRFEDNDCKYLWFSVWHSDWNNRESDPARKAIAHASIAFYERALLLAYVKKYGRLPELNLE